MPVPLKERVRKHRAKKRLKDSDAFKKAEREGRKKRRKLFKPPPFKLPAKLTYWQIARLFRLARGRHMKSPEHQADPTKCKVCKKPWKLETLTP